MLICSAYEGVEEQTRRHAYVLKLLGLHQTVVAYNKMDLVDYDRKRFDEVKVELNEFLRRVDITPSLEIPVSAKEGDNIASRSANMPWYDGPIVLEALDRFEKSSLPVDKPVRLPIQDVYEMDGQKLAVARIESGVLRPGDSLTFMPSGERKRITSIKKWRLEDLQQASAGECIGVVFDSDPPPRGEVGSPPDSVTAPVKVFEASIFWLAKAPLKAGEELGLRCSTQHSPCRVSAIRERVDSGSLEHIEQGAAELLATEVGEVTIATDMPVVVEDFQDVPELGRFVLLRGSDTVAGGIVTAPK